ncbi:gliding motility-associated peptidyl-prolyl isomerase GldI [Robiginitalea sp. IMCC44478]|uniref:gliding motility-associated peptidyl-prolyl isomerase GldI n=1 Tax=Robiginitalea sp. IMCC44478 TaxID=3459122 RepID=UPI0040411ECF
MRKIVGLLCLIITIIACEGPQPRRPVEVKGGSFLKQSAERNKDLLAKEEAFLQELITKDSLHSYVNTASGSIYYYEIQQDSASYKPRPDDLVTLTYNIMSWNNDTIYRKSEIGELRYKVDKQELFPGLRNSVKLLAEGEKATFLFPSSLAYGYHGDNDRIGPNVPIKSTIEILKIEKNTESK